MNTRKEIERQAHCSPNEVRRLPELCRGRRSFESFRKQVARDRARRFVQEEAMPCRRAETVFS